VTVSGAARGGAGWVPILAYHSVSDQAEPGFRRYTISSSLFREHAAFLVASGYSTLTISDVAAGLRHGLPDRCVALTFDDAFGDFAESALPTLRDFRMTATLYVPTRFVGGASSWLAREGEAHRPILDWSQILEAAAAGIECGGHSDTHQELDRLSRRELEREVRRPKEILEEHLGREVQTFAYPFGYHSRRARRAVASAGYTSACAVGGLSATIGSDRFAIPRLTVACDTDTRQLGYLLSEHAGRRDRAVSELKRGLWRARRRWLPR
jgi:peptidoglycan/xylan/chitin deacetylase (PgdA/CDA1 family)